MKRYDPTIGWKGFAEMAEYSHGEFVRFADVDPLLEQMAAALRGADASMPTVCDQHCSHHSCKIKRQVHAALAAYDAAKGTP